MEKNKRGGRVWMWVLGAIVVISVGTVLGIWLWLSQHTLANRSLDHIKTVRGIRVDYLDIGQSRAVVGPLEQQMKQAGVNLVALSAGRADWTYFPWAGHSDSWSSEVQTSGTDFLGDDSRRFSQWAHVTAVVDVLGPRYIAAHPETAAVSYQGVPSKDLVATMELVEGDYGKQVLALIDAVATNYPVNSISLAELVYHVDGFGDRDKAAYMAYTNRADWPRTEAGDIDLGDPLLGEWRSYEVGRFVEQAAAVAHKHGKQLFLEVRASPADLAEQAASTGTRYDLMLKYADRLVAWDNEGLAPASNPERLQAMARYFSAYGPDRVILLLGLWQQTDGSSLLDKGQQTPVAPTTLKASLDAAQQGGATSVWIAPSFLLTADHWAALHSAWAPAATKP